MALPLFIVDAFAEKRFSGNPAAVCLLDRGRNGAWLQAVAAEMNLSETAFPLIRESFWVLRWFTPLVEVELCGHATLATAHVLWETGRIGKDEPVMFTTRSGNLTCRRAGKSIEMDFPAEPAAEAAPPKELLEGLGVRPAFVGRNRMDWIVQLESEAAVRRVTPDQTRLVNVPTRGIIVTAKSGGEYDFVSRAFFPRLGVPEDPVCGSAHCCLGPFWRERLGKDELVGHQVSQRGGVVHVRCAGDRVTLGGRAVTVMRGELVG